VALVRRLAATLLLTIGIAPGCAPAQEYLLLERFFHASRLLDRTALARFSTVIFEPLEHGTVTAFEVVGVSPDRWVQLPLEIRRQVASLSLADALNPVDVEDAAVRIEVREVAVDAMVRRPNGSPVERALTVTLERAVPESGSAIVGRWIVTAFR